MSELKTCFKRVDYARARGYLAEKGMTLRSGTVVDTTIIDAPSSTKNNASPLLGKFCLANPDTRRTQQIEHAAESGLSL